MVRAVEVAAHDNRLPRPQRRKVRRQVFIPPPDPVLQPPQTLPCGARQFMSCISSVVEEVHSLRLQAASCASKILTCCLNEISQHPAVNLTIY